MWVGPNWALNGELESTAVYDSNLTARDDGQDDFYGSLAPKLVLARRNAATRLELDAQVVRTWFMDYSEYDSTDPQVNLLLAYPDVPSDEPRTHLDLHWGRLSSTNTDLGRRVRSEVWRGRWDQRVFDTGRTIGAIRIDGRSTDFQEQDLNKNSSYALEGRLAYGVSGAARLGLGYGHEWTKSRGAPGRGDTEGEEDRVTARLFGMILPKLSGSIEGGVAWVSYTGAIERDDSAWIGSANLRWEAAAGTYASMRAARYTDYSPEGSTALRSEALVELTRELGRGFSLRAGGGVSQVETYVDTDVRRADAVVLTAGLAYQLTDRFSAELSERWTRQDEDRDAFDYERHVVTGEITFLF